MLFIDAVTSEGGSFGWLRQLLVCCHLVFQAHQEVLDRCCVFPIVEKREFPWLHLHPLFATLPLAGFTHGRFIFDVNLICGGF